VTKIVNADVRITDRAGDYAAETNGWNTYSTRYTFGANPGNRWVIGGEGSVHTMATSMDGIIWKGMGKTTFATRCNQVLWNGYVWVAVGAGSSPQYYSRDGLQWTACPGPLTYSEGLNIAWNGRVMVSTGIGGFGYSQDGLRWTDASANVFGTTPTVEAVAWNGVYWIAGSNGNIHRLARSQNGSDWTGIDASNVFSRKCSALLWTGSQWIGGGQTDASAGVLAYSEDQGQTWTNASNCPINTAVSGLATNGKILVAVGSGATHTIAYSYNGVVWTGLGTAMFTNTATRASVRWVGNKFIAFSSGTNTLAYSYDGIRWMKLTNSTGIFDVAAYGGDSAIALAHSVSFPNNEILMGNLVSRDGGETWSTHNSFNANVIGWNGQQYVFGNTSSGHTVVLNAYSGEYTNAQYGDDPATVNAVQWNGEYWLMGGTSTTTDKHHLIKSSDGYNWVSANASAYFAANFPCNGIAWNGTAWVVSGKTSSTATTMLYSTDGNNWTQTSTTLGGGQVAWNGAYFLCGGPADNGNTHISTSSDGIHWQSTQIGVYGEVSDVAWNNGTWVVAANAVDGSGVLLTSYNGSTWTNDTAFANAYTGGKWCGSQFVFNTNTNAVRTSYDGSVWNTVSTSQTTGREVFWSEPQKGYAEIQQPTVVGGVGGEHTMAVSADGILYRGLGKTVFSIACHAAVWNGQLWVAGGKGQNHTLAYSYDAVQWTGLGTGVFSEGCYGVSYNGQTWLALGSGGNTIARSTDGKTWSGLGQSVWDGSGLSADWNGTAWVAGGSGSTNSLVYTTDATAQTGWTGLGKPVFSSKTNDVRWMMGRWVATGVGGNTLAYTSNASGNIGWTGQGTTVFSSSGNGIYWNGRVAVAVGSGGNTIATTTDGGANWTGRGTSVFSTSGNSVRWNTRRWIATGAGTNTVAYSYNGTDWYASPDTNGLFGASAHGIGANSRMGVWVANSGVVLSVNDRLTITTPEAYDASVMADTAISFRMNLSGRT
jgi:hypothetical protein